MRQKLKRYLFEGEVLRLMSMTMLVKPLGMITQMLIAKYVGAGAHYDAYVLTVFLVSYMDFTFGRVFQAVVVPFTIKLRNELSRHDLMAFQNWAYLVFLVPAAAYVALLVSRGDIPLGLASPGAPEETRDLAARMLRWMAIPGLMLVMITMFKATLNLNKRFRVPAAMPLLNSFSVITVLVLLHDRMGIWALPLAFSISCLLRLTILVSWAVIQRYAAPARPSVPKGTSSKLWALRWMILLSTAFLTMNAFIDKMFASGLVEGSISSIAYSNTIMNFGVQLFTLSLVTVMFTRMSEMMSTGDMVGCSGYLGENFNRMARLVVPGALAFSVASTEIVIVLYQRGAFAADPDAAGRTAATFAMYMLGLPAIIFNAVVTKVFHSLQRMRDKIWLSLQFLLTNTAGNMLLVGSMKVVGLAVSSSIAINIHLALSLWVLHRYRTGLDIGRYVKTMIRAYVIGAATWTIYHFGGIEAWIGTLVAEPSKLDYFWIGASRGIFVFVLFMGLYQAWSLISRRRV